MSKQVQVEINFDTLLFVDSTTQELVIILVNVSK